MTVDKPPLSLWIQALSVRVFGYHPLSILVPQALMGVAAVWLMYDLVGRRFGRAAGFAAGLALASTPIIVAMSRHNNPDELLVLCSVAAVWCAARAFESGRTRWLVLSGICVGLGFETKMLIALVVVPGIAVAWLWTRFNATHGRWRAVRQLFAGGAAMVAVAGAWPLLVMLTPAADRPWVSGTSDNSIWSLIFGYNGFGRVAGQTGGPGGGGFGGGGPGGGVFGGQTGVFRLLQSSLGDQAGWLLGFAIAAGLGLLVLTRLRRNDPRTGWLIMIGGAFATTAVVFSFASGIFHPYYVSLLAPFTAALVGAGVGMILTARGSDAGAARAARILAPLLIVAGAVTELVVLHELDGSLAWATPLVIAVGGACAVLLAVNLSPRVRAAIVAVAVVALFAAPATWAAETIGHPTSSTFPAGGPASGGPGGPGGFRGGRGSFGGGAGAGSSQGAGAVTSLFGSGSSAAASASGIASAAGAPPGAGGVPRGGFFPRGGAGGFRGGPGGFGGGGGFGAGGAFGGDTAGLSAATSYAKAHGGGTIGVESQSSAAAVIISSDANVAGLGGFSGRESSVTTAWIAQEVGSGHLRWLLLDNSGQGGGLQGDARTGSEAAMSAAARVCRADTVTTSGGTSVTLYDCLGRASAILQAAKG
jgi:4-amino-4-deoxy-L-arabinose transferase-like glycosyltransferase